jgi:hypothetical protein
VDGLKTITEKGSNLDSATVLVILLTAGGIALLVWFEINSRRNAQRKEQVGSPAQSVANSGRK